MKEEIKSLIRKYDLEKHPEGGYYKETYRSKGVIPKEALNAAFDGNRNYATSIYFLLTSDNFSAFHRILQDEIWNFHCGSNLFIHCILPNGDYRKIELGVLGNAQPQYVVPAGTWFASSVVEKNSYSMVGCTVAPGFDFEDFELALRDDLAKKFPQHLTLIEQLTRG